MSGIEENGAMKMDWENIDWTDLQGMEEMRLGELAIKYEKEHKVSKMSSGIEKSFRRVQENELNKNSLKTLGECEIDIFRSSVVMYFKTHSFSLSEIELKALIEFKKDNNLYLSGVHIDIVKNSYRATVLYSTIFYPEDEEEVN